MEVSHGSHTYDGPGRQRGPASQSTKLNTAVSHTSQPSPTTSNKPLAAWQRLSASSSVSGGRLSTESNEGQSMTATRRPNPSASQRLMSTQSGIKLESRNSLRQHLTSTSQTHFKPRPPDSLHRANDARIQPQTTLRRKQPGARAPSSKSSGESPKTSFDTDTDSLLGFPYEKHQTTKVSATMSNTQARNQQPMELPPDLIPELQALAISQPRPSTAQAYSLGSISSPSTQYTESPEPWSSRNTTPMSMPSYSPGIVQPLRINQSGKRANTVPLPSNPRIRAPRLPVLPEALTSSSSSEAGREHGGNYKVQTQTPPATPKKQKKPRIDEMEAPTPPPRSASVKATSVDVVLDSGVGSVERQASRRREEVSNPEESPLAKRSSGTINFTSTSFTNSSGTTSKALIADNSSKLVRPGWSRSISQDRQQPTATQPNLGSSSSMKAKQPIQSMKSTERANIKPPLKPFGHNAMKNSQDSTYTSSITGPASRIPLKGRPSPYISPTGSQQSQNEVIASLQTKAPGKLARLGALFRGKKTPEPESTKAVSRKLQRKGPAAGTGHEGYGKYAKHSKKISLSSGTADSQRSTNTLEKIPSRSESAKTGTSARRDSKIRTSQSDIEEFVAQRLKPVHIMGGSKRISSDHQHNWSTSESGSQSILAPSHSHQLSSDSFVSGYSERAGGSTSQVNDLVSNSYLSTRTDLQRQTSISGITTLPEIPPTSQYQASFPHLTRTETPRSSMSTSQTSIPAYVRPIHFIEESLLKKSDKKGKKLKWNIFSRNKPATRPPAPIVEPSPELPVQISTVAISRPLPYYAMIESESENNVSEIGEFLEQVVEPPLRPYIEQPPLPHQEYHRPQSTLLPSLPVMRGNSLDTFRESLVQAATAKVPRGASPPNAESSEGRPRRLAQVGRIPRVVSRKDRTHTPNAHSFSRPFQPSGQEQYPHLTKSAEDERPQLEIHTELLPARPFTDVDSGKPASAPAQMLSGSRDLGITLAQEDMTTSDRQESQISTSTSSEGLVYVATPSHGFLQASQRPISRYHGEDEVWNEYDDLLDHVMSPSQSKGKYPESVVIGQKTSSSPLVPQQRLQGLTYDPSAISTSSNPTTQTPAIVFPETLDESRLSGDIRLRRSRIISALHSSIDPSSPFSVARFFAGCSDGDKSSAERLSVSTQGATNFLSASPHLAIQNRSSGDSSSQPEAILFDVVEKEHDPAADNELHYASLMISRWLSFGRVLFSPAQDEVFNQSDKHVLVLDGLRNEDFSYYCAVTFKRAYVHSLKEAEPRRRKPSESGHAPPNFRSAEVTSFGDKFPFPPSFFSVVVLRFLPVMSDRTLLNLITEAKRVLVPGGHLELMLLDLDIVNMGTNTRRAVRELKIRTTNNDAGISLKPISDNIQTILGRKGFANLNRCVVGVPVAGKIAGSMDSSSSSRSSGGSFARQNRFSQDSQKAAAHRAANPHIGENFSLNDLISDHTPGSDEKIAKIVSKTARFWFTHCYEPTVARGAKSARSILAERKVLNECKMRASSFKLLIAHTQKPIEFKRRTVSEPMLPTLVTAGVRQPRRNVL